MKLKYLAIGLMMLFCLSVFGQQKKAVPMTVQPQKTEVQVLEETVLQLQAENQAMQKQMESIEKEVELYRGDVRNKVAEFDEDQSRWLTILTIIIGLIGVVFGIGVPLYINNDNRKRMENRFSEMKDDLKDLVNVATEQAGNATTQANNAKEALIQIQPQIKFATEQVSSATEQVRTATTQALKAEEASNMMQIQVKTITEQVASATVQAMVATEQAKQAKQALAEIEDLKKHVDELEKKINEDAHAAEKAAKEAQANSYFAQAVSVNDPSKAIDLYTKAIELKPDFVVAFYNRGIEKSKLNKYEGELEDYNQAIKLKSDFTFAYFNRGNVKVKLGDFPGALIDFSKVIELDPNDPEAYINRGNVRARLGDYSGALVDYDKAISLNNEYPEAYTNRAKCYRKLAKMEKDPTKKAELIAKAEADEMKIESLKKDKEQ